MQQLHAGTGNEWTTVPQAPTSLQQNVFPTTFTMFKLDILQMKAQLAKAGTTPASGVLIYLPVNGAVQELLVWKDNVLAAELQQKFPEIQNFTAVDPNNHAISAKLDLNIYGFGAMIFDPTIGTFVIDPYSLQSDEYYISFFRRDMDLNIYKPGLCTTKDPSVTTLENLDNAIQLPNMNPASDPSLGMKSNGAVKRTYRLAVSCTGEWASMITGGAPSMTAVLGVMSSVINRCNGVFQRELSVKMELITQNNEVVYLDAASDPYSCPGETHDCLIDQVQDAMDVEFPGATNYDIGHIFCTTGGGLAQLYSVCATGTQARGVSGVFSSSDIGTVIHEMGHQMGTGHTFASDAGGCNGNGSEPSAYEPGSGTSIMSYNGSCPPDNVASADVDYYHIASLKMMGDNISAGGSGLCGSTIPGYTPVTVTTLGQTYKIPKNTPFELIADEAITSEPAPPAVTYSWEQWDLGNFGENESGSADWEEGPTFISKAPSVRKDRQFPDNVLVAAGTYASVGQRLSTVERSLNFKLTTRSFFEAWGTFNYSNDKVQMDVVDCEPFRVTAPSTTALYEVNAPITITWDTVQTRQAPINCGFVNIHMSINGGLTFPFIVATNVPNMGSFNLLAPNVYSDDIRFKVKGSGNVFYDINKTSIKIHGDFLSINPDVKIANDLKIYPNPTNNTLYLRNANMVKTPYVITMYNVSGQKVYESRLSQNLDIDVSKFSKGLYMIQIWDETVGAGRTEKIIVQ